MRRDYFTLEVADGDGSDGDKPTATVAFDGPSDVLDDRFTGELGDVDVAFRYQTGVTDEEASGVFSVTDRVTGEYVLEVNVEAADVLELVEAARKYGGTDADGCYRVRLTTDGTERAATSKRTLLIYDSEGSLLRQHSLIPGGVEL